jgi:hypothetical protein
VRADGSNELLDAAGEAFEFVKCGGKADAGRFRQSRFFLMQDEGAREQAQQFAMARIEPFPELAAVAAIAAEPLFGGRDGLALRGFGNERRWLLLNHCRTGSRRAQWIWPSASTRPVTRSARVSNTSPPYFA